MNKKNETAQEGVATEAENNKLKHSVDGVTTRDDLLDAGVPMLPGSPSEPQGPEDAFGKGPKRGDYTDRVESGPHYTSELIPESERTPGGPTSRLVPQAPRTLDIGDAPGKGGVTTQATEELQAERNRNR